MTNPDPDRLRREIEYTQHNLSTDVDRLAEKVTPGRIVHRRVDRARRAMTSARDRVMGSASDVASTTSDQASSMADRASNMASEAGQRISDAPSAVRRGTEGNPIAAGLIAFGAGWLLSTLAPASKQEQRLAGQATEWAREQGQAVGGQVAQQVKENLGEPVREAVESVRSTASDAASTVADEARAAADDVSSRAQEAKSTVQNERARRSPLTRWWGFPQINRTVKPPAPLLIATWSHSWWVSHRPSPPSGACAAARSPANGSAGPVPPSDTVTTTRSGPAQKRTITGAHRG